MAALTCMRSHITACAQTASFGHVSGHSIAMPVLEMDRNEALISIVIRHSPDHQYDAGNAC